jgi:hypothetical protein
VTVPIGTSGIAMVFDDGARTLRYDVAQASFRIGSQLFGDGLVPVSAGPDGTVLPTGLSANALGQLYLAGGASVTAGGRLTVFGTSGAEQITVTQGQVGFDPTFNLGGDTLVLNQAATTFMARFTTSSSSAVLDGAQVDATIPVGTSGLTLSFPGGDDRLLVYELTAPGPGLFIGDQAIGTAPVGLIA